MNLMKFRLLFLIFFLSALTVAGQSPARTLKRAEKAMGGAKALQSTNSWRKTGTIKRVSDGTSGKITVQMSKPNLYRLGFDIQGFEVESGYNGRSGWTRDSRSGLQTLTGNAAAALQAEAAFRNSLWLNAKKDRTKIVSGGQVEVAGRPTNLITLSTSKGAVVKLFFDSTTDLLARQEFVVGDVRRAFDYSDYRTVNGIAQPGKTRIEIDGAMYEAVFDQITAGAPVAQADFDFPSISGAPLPDVPTLLQEVQANEDHVERMLDSYSFLQKFTQREFDKNGILREKDSATIQMSFYKGFRIARVIEKNGKPLTPSEQADEDKKAEKYVEEIEKKIAKREATGERPEAQRRVSIGEVLRASLLKNPRRERFRGRDVIVFDFEPNPAFDYKNAKSMLKFFGKTAGAIWIDEKDKQVARVEAYLADSFNIAGGVLAKLRKGATFTLEQERVNDEIWLPSLADINMSVRVLLVKGIELNQVIRSYDYRKFSTEVKDAKVDSLKENR
jgi:outer membrane lipoprotein-sorting protein